MKHITGTGCGYDLTGGRTIYGGTFGDWVYGSTHNCKGLDPLNENFLTTEITGSTEHPFDNYSNLPQKIKGFVMTLSPILNMATNVSGLELTAPEVSCVQNFDPVEAPTATIDYYELYGDNRIYVSVNGGTTQIRGPEMWDTLYVTGSTLFPGALEPMIDTNFPPIGVNAPPALDLNVTGTLIPPRLLVGWQDMIVGKINDLYRKSWGNYDYSGLNGLLNLVAADNENSGCANFQISVESADPPALQEVDAQHPAIPPNYHISDGVVYIDGTRTEVQGIHPYTVIDPDTEEEFVIDAKIREPFIAFLDVYGNTASILHEAYIYEAIDLADQIPSDPTTLIDYPTHREPGHHYFFIGAVRMLDNVNTVVEESGKHYVLYEIIQGDCITDITLSGGTGGDVYNGPFHVKAEGNGIKIDCIRSRTVNGEEQCIEVGRVYINGSTYRIENNQTISGSTVSLTPEDGQVYVFAHVTGSTVTFDTDPESTGAPPAYTVRLARISNSTTAIKEDPVSGSTTYVLSGAITVDQWHHGDIYVDGRWM